MKCWPDECTSLQLSILLPTIRIYSVSHYHKLTSEAKEKKCNLKKIDQQLNVILIKSYLVVILDTGVHRVSQLSGPSQNKGSAYIRGSLLWLSAIQSCLWDPSDLPYAPHCAFWISTETFCFSTPLFVSFGHAVCCYAVSYIYSWTCL